MVKVKCVHTLLASLAVVGMCLPEAAIAAAPATRPAVTDVALADGGVLRGQVVSPDTGAGVANTPVTIRMQDQIVATTTTDANGRFAVQNLRGGVHQVISGEGEGVYRFWSPGTAPPAAQENAVVYTQTAPSTESGVPVEFTRDGGFKMLLANPWFIGAVVATAVAVPIAVSANRHHASP